MSLNRTFEVLKGRLPTWSATGSASLNRTFEVLKAEGLSPVVYGARV